MDKENVIFCKIHSEFVPIVNIVFLAGSRTPKTINTNTGGQRFTGNYVLMISTNYYSEALAEFWDNLNYASKIIFTYTNISSLVEF